MLIYVDDIIVTGSNTKSLEKCIHKLNLLFSLKNQGPLDYFLGIELYRDEVGVYLSQGKYVMDLLKKIGMENTKSCPTPIVIRKTLTIQQGEPLHNSTQYRSTLGALQYLTNTRPNIAFLVNKLSQFLQYPIGKQ